jgi:hypothetical protein
MINIYNHTNLNFKIQLNTTWRYYMENMTKIVYILQVLLYLNLRSINYI